MKKLAVLAVACLVLAVAAVAYAQTQQNTYGVSGKNTPSKAGTKKKPVNVVVDFGYTVGEANGNRPSPVRTYSIKTPGMKVNTQAFPKCSISQLEEDPEGCPSGSKVGTGFIENESGATANPADKSIECNAKLDVYNLGSNRGAIYVAGSPESQDPRTRCAIALGAPIAARWVRIPGGVALEFDVPDSLLHPLPTLDNAVVKVTSRISGKTRRYRGRKVSFYQSIGGCRKGKRKLTVTFTSEAGQETDASEDVACRK